MTVGTDTFVDRALPADDDGQATQPIPDGFTWTGATGRVWTARGDGLTLTLSVVDRAIVYEWEPVTWQTV